MPSESDFEQTDAMREAIDWMLLHLGGAEDRRLRKEIARVVVGIASQRECDAETLVALAIEKLGEPSRKTHAGVALRWRTAEAFRKARLI
jgi:hypothetical protein